MLLAHTAGAGGPHIEFLLVGAALVLLSVIFFVQKSVKPFVSVILLLGGFALAGGAFAVGGDEATATQATVSIVSPQEGETVPANEPVTVEIALAGGTLTQDMESDDPNEGHLHLFVNGDLVAMPVSDQMQVELEPGENLIEVEFTQANHASFDPTVMTSVRVEAE